MVPMPIESEKKAWPSATSMVEGVIFAKSGRRKKRIPSAAPGSSSERTASTMSAPKSSGMSSRADRSIPFCTPRAMTKWVARTNSAV